MAVNPIDAAMAVKLADILQDGNWLNTTLTVERPGAPTMRITRSADGVRIEFGDDHHPTNR